jgi:hypothetical protein
MPGIHACRIIERQTISKEAEHLVVEQHGEFRFMLFAQATTVRLKTEHRLQRVAGARAVSFDLGPFKRRAIDVFEGRYELTPQTPARERAPDPVALCRRDRASPPAAACPRYHRRSPEPPGPARRGRAGGRPPQQTPGICMISRSQNPP